MANLFCCGLNVLLILGQLTCVASAEVLSSNEGRFSVEVPKLPTPQYQWVDSKTSRTWIVSYREQPAQRTVSPAYLEKFYDSVVQGVLDGTKATLVRQDPITRDNITGREIVTRGGTAERPIMTRQQFFLTTDYFYVLTFSGPPSTETSTDVEEFFASFQMRPTNTVAVQPDPQIRYGRVGVQFKVMTEDMAAQMKMNEPRGVVVTAVDEQGGAKKAGIQPGDVIITMDGREIKKAADLPRVVAEIPPGKKVDVVIVRIGREQTLSITLGP
jgi:hypothetical protein